MKNRRVYIICWIEGAGKEKYVACNPSNTGNYMWNKDGQGQIHRGSLKSHSWFNLLFRLHEALVSGSSKGNSDKYFYEGPENN